MAEYVTRAELEQLATETAERDNAQHARIDVLERIATAHSLQLGSNETAVQQLRMDVARLDKKLDRRFDTLDAKLDSRTDALDQKIDGVRAELSAKIDSRTDALDKKIDSRTDALDQKIDGVRAELSTKIDSRTDALDKKIDGVRTELSAKIDSIAEDIRSEMRTGFEKLTASIAHLEALLTFLIKQNGIPYNPELRGEGSSSIDE